LRDGETRDSHQCVEVKVVDDAADKAAKKSTEKDDEDAEGESVAELLQRSQQRQAQIAAAMTETSMGATNLRVPSSRRPPAQPDGADDSQSGLSAGAALAKAKEAVGLVTSAVASAWSSVTGRAAATTTTTSE
jgi:hypothetical protein